jgi:2-polyprenyl-3-methyl-5-hydroxy-6-metoxy-1,4-benzoquinol methylase
MLLTAKFQCPECRGSLGQTAADILACAACGTTVPVRDGIADFVRGRFDTQLDVEAYDREHGIDDQRPSRFYDQIRARAGHRWPAHLGSVIQIGCGTGLYSRALLAANEAHDVVMTDVSVGMLLECRTHLRRLGVLEGRTVAFATYSSNEACMRDAVFDTCIGTSVLHHIPDVRAFLGDLLRGLKPGGRAFFIEPARRYHQALAQALADIAAHLLARSSGVAVGFQGLLNWLAQQRQSLMFHGDIAFVSQLEDKHQFIPEEFADLAADIGFATAEAIPFGPDPDGSNTARLLCGEIGVEAPARDAIVAMMPAVGNRFMRLLGPTDNAPSFLLWLTKGRGPAVRIYHEPAPPPHAAVRPDGGGTPARWSMLVSGHTAAAGLEVTVDGWYLSNVDVQAIRVTLGDVSHDVPLWLPRPDVQQAMNQNGRVAAWNALCCGAHTTLSFPGLAPDEAGIPLRLEVVFTDRGTARLPGPERLIAGAGAQFTG